MNAPRPALQRQMIAELNGRFFLTLAGAGIEIVDVLHPGISTGRQGSRARLSGRRDDLPPR